MPLRGNEFFRYAVIMNFKCPNYEAGQRSRRCIHSDGSKGCDLLRKHECIEFLRVNKLSLKGHPFNLGDLGVRGGTPHTNTDTSGQQTAALGRRGITLDKHAAEMIVALSDIFPHCEINISED